MSHKCGKNCRRLNGRGKCDTCRGKAPRSGSTAGEGQLTTIVRVARPSVKLKALEREK